MPKTNTVQRYSSLVPFFWSLHYILRNMYSDFIYHTTTIGSSYQHLILILSNCSKNPWFIFIGLIASLSTIPTSLKALFPAIVPPQWMGSFYTKVAEPYDLDREAFFFQVLTLFFPRAVVLWIAEGYRSNLTLTSKGGIPAILKSATSVPSLPSKTNLLQQLYLVRRQLGTSISSVSTALSVDPSRKNTVLRLFDQNVPMFLAKLNELIVPQMPLYFVTIRYPGKLNFLQEIFLQFWQRSSI